MVKRIIRPLSVLLCAVLVALQLPITPVDASSPSSEIRAIEKQLAELDAKKQEYEQRIDEINAAESTALQTKSSLEEQIGVLEQKISSTTELIAQYDALIAQTEEQIAGKSDEIDAKFNEFLERMRISYEDGFVNYLVLILESESLTDLMMNTERTADMLEYERTLMNGLETEKGTLEESKASLEAARAAQKEAKSALESDRKEVEGRRTEVNSYINTLTNDEEMYQQMLEEAWAADEELNARLEAALAALAAKEVKQHPVSDGSLIWPVSVNYNTISSPYGTRTIWGRQSFHYGIDIPAPAGSNVYAAQAGVVEYSEWHYSYGNFVVINHGGGYTTLYAHNTSNAVSVGQTVAQGDVIAYVGTTGSSTGNHCHLEVRYNGAHQNPLNFLTQP